MNSDIYFRIKAVYHATNYGYCWMGVIFSFLFFFLSLWHCSGRIVRLITPIGFTGVALGLDDNLLFAYNFFFSAAPLICRNISIYSYVTFFCHTRNSRRRALPILIFYLIKPLFSTTLSFIRIDSSQVLRDKRRRSHSMVLARPMS